MKTITRIATWIDAVLTVVVAFVLRRVVGGLAFLLKRGRHRPWRRRGSEAAERRSEAARG